MNSSVVKLVLLLSVAGATVFTENVARRWPRGVVPYESSFATEDVRTHRISGAIAILHNRTLARYTARQPGTDVVWIRFVDGSGCGSYIGRNQAAGPQDITVALACETGNILHEMLHSLGVFHEQSRPDRDQYVFVDQTRYAGNVNYAIQSRAWLLGAYDYGSVMHYPRLTGFYPTKEPNAPIGQRDGLSDRDVAVVNWIVSKPTQDPAAGGSVEPKPPAPAPTTDCSNGQQCNFPHGTCVHLTDVPSGKVVGRCYCAGRENLFTGPQCTDEISGAPPPPAPPEPTDPCLAMIANMRSCVTEPAGDPGGGDEAYWVEDDPDELNYDFAANDENSHGPPLCTDPTH